MALKMTNYYLDNGLFAPMVFFKIESINGTVNNMSADVKFYVSEEAIESGVNFIEQKIYTFTPDVSKEAQNYHIQGYEFLKTLEEFKNAVDV